MDISKQPADADHAEKQPSPAGNDPVWEDPRVKAIKRKVDIRLSATLAVMYIVNQIDRSNLSNAVVAGMDETLEFKGTNRYSIIVLLFVPTYVLFQPIATVLARRLGPRPFLAAITLAFGLVVLGFGFVDDWAELAGLRVLLGAFEACFFPSALFLVSMWYVRRKVAKRNAFFYLVGNSVGGFGGVLAYGLQQMDGLGGLEGWRWILIMEGVITAIIALVGYTFLIDFPEDAYKTKSFLTSEEIKIMVDRVERDRDDAHVTPFSLRTYLAQGKDWKVWLFALDFGLSGLVTYAVSYFLRIILRNTLGFSVVQAQCLTAPCYAFSFLLDFLEFLPLRQIQPPRPRPHLQRPPRNHRHRPPRLRPPTLRPLLRRLPRSPAARTANIPASMTYQANNVVGQ